MGKDLTPLDSLPMRRDPIFINHDLFRSPNATDKNWREEWFAIHKTYILQQGLSEEEAGFIISHMRERDFPISMAEMGALLKKAGLEVSCHAYSPLDYPRPDFFGMVVGLKKILTPAADCD